jgi:eukaryotic-like serine/threonine-protein kinase
MTLVKMDLLAQRKICEACGSSVEFEMPSGFCPACLLTTVIESSETVAAGSHIEDYELLNEVARGGMGIVYRARQRVPSRIVALKMILPAHVGSADAMKRFRAETEAVASLEHEGILPIYAVGEHDGAPFYNMKFAEGGTLSARIDNYRDKPREAATLIAKLARAVAYAHEHGILHRDLKPGNVLFDSANKPYVSDFGLAKWLARKSDLTQTFAVLGTPFYMAPEQAISSHMVTASADIYSLGAILYHVLTGNPPFTGDTPMEVLHRAAEQPTPRPRLTNRSIPPDLETICLKCLEKDPAWRYSSAAALADDLDRFCTGHAIEARRIGLTARARKWVRRKPAIAALIASLVALAAVVGWNIWKSELLGHPVTTGIAVLPFENLSDEKEHDFFADGVQDDILTKLAKIADLKVISRTSVMEYRGKRNLRQIGNELRVSHVLEGSVRRTGARLHMNTQLIDTRTDTHLWAEQYDRDLNDLFAIQSEIAQKVAEQLHTKISAGEKLAIEDKPTTDLVANALYVQARELESKEALPKSLLEAVVRLLEEAVARDPQFVPAYCELGRMHLQIFHWDDHTPARLELAKAAIQNAVRLQPDAGEVHRTLAMYAYWGFFDYDRARAELDLARRTLPNDAWIYYITGLIDRRQGRWTEAIRSLKRAVELDPRNTGFLMDAAGTYTFLRRYSESGELWERVVAVAPRKWGPPVWRAELTFSQRADVRPLRKELSALLAEHPEAAKESEFAWRLLLCAMVERDPAAVKRALASIPVEGILEGNSIMYPREFFAGFAARAFNDATGAHASFTAARAIAEKLVRDQPDNGVAWNLLGLIDAGLGRKEEAVREGRRACELLPMSKDAVLGVALIADLAIIYAWTGEKDLALEQLAVSAQTPAGVIYGDLKLNPVWDSLRGDSRFEKIVASLAPTETATR